MVILPNMAKTVKRPLFHYFFAFFHILRCPYHGFSGHRVFLTHFWGCMRGGLWVLCAEVQKSQNASPVLKVLPPPRGGGGKRRGGGRGRRRWCGVWEGKVYEVCFVFLETWLY